MTQLEPGQPPRRNGGRRRVASGLLLLLLVLLAGPLEGDALHLLVLALLALQRESLDGLPVARGRASRGEHRRGGALRLLLEAVGRIGDLDAARRRRAVDRPRALLHDVGELVRQGPLRLRSPRLEVVGVDDDVVAHRVRGRLHRLGRPAIDVEAHVREVRAEVLLHRGARRVVERRAAAPDDVVDRRAGLVVALEVGGGRRVAGRALEPEHRARAQARGRRRRVEAHRRLARATRGPRLGRALDEDGFFTFAHGTPPPVEMAPQLAPSSSSSLATTSYHLPNSARTERRPSLRYSRCTARTTSAIDSGRRSAAAR